MVRRVGVVQKRFENSRKKGYLMAPPAPPLNLPMNSSYKMTDWQGKHCSCKCDDEFGYRRLPRSVSFKTNGKLLTGQNFLKRIISRAGFLSNGKTEASFQATGNLPDLNEILINLVSTGSRTSHQQPSYNWKRCFLTGSVSSLNFTQYYYIILTKHKSNKLLKGYGIPSDR